MPRVDTALKVANEKKHLHLLSQIFAGLFSSSIGKECEIRNAAVYVREKKLRTGIHNPGKAHCEIMRGQRRASLAPVAGLLFPYSLDGSSKMRLSTWISTHYPINTEYIEHGCATSETESRVRATNRGGHRANQRRRSNHQSF